MMFDVLEPCISSLHTLLRCKIEDVSFTDTINDES